MITTFIEREAEPILISDLTWREFKAVEQLIDRPGLRLSFLDGVNRKHPDLVIEVVVSSGGINKLEAYKRLQIPELL